MAEYLARLWWRNLYDLRAGSLRERVQALATQGDAKPSVLLTFENLDAGEITPAGAWEDLKSTRVLGDVDKIAIVTDGGVIDKAAAAADKMTPLTIEVFSSDQRDHAMAWLTQ